MSGTSSNAKMEADILFIVFNFIKSHIQKSNAWYGNIVKIGEGCRLPEKMITFKSKLYGRTALLQDSPARTTKSSGLGLSVLLFFVCSMMPVAQAAQDPAGGAGMSDMVLIPAGAYDMGSKGDEYPDNEKPRHRVTLRSFSIDRHEVTNEMFAVFLNAVRPAEGKNSVRWQWIVLRDDLERVERSSWYPSEIIFKGGGYLPVRGFEKYPVVSVSWQAADAYCRWTGKRLPTEAEWEKAARGTLEHADFPWGDTMPPLESGPVFGKRWSDNTLPPPFREAGNYPPNTVGIYDMAGNVAEWCSDWYDETYYRSSSSEDPQGPQKGMKKVVRGGSWVSLPAGLRVGARYASAPETLSNTVGFRCAKDPDGK